MIKDPADRRYLAVYLFVVVCFTAIILWANSRLVYFRDNPVNFYALNKKAFVIEVGLTRRQSASIKLGFIEHYPPPLVGLFGNHQFQYFTLDAFDEKKDNRYFFNFWYENLALPEIKDYLSYLESIKKLPLQTIIVQITTPNNDNGRFILGYNGELPSEFVKFSEKRGLNDYFAKLKHYCLEWDTRLQQTFNYSSVIFGLFKSSVKGRVLNTDSCNNCSDLTSSPYYGMISKLPVTIRNTLLPDDPRKYCDPIYFAHGLRFDGGHDVRYVLVKEPILNDNELRENTRFLKYGDEKQIARHMKEIDAIGNRNGRKVVFVVPPVYETYRPSSVDNIFDAAIKLIPEVEVIDQRALRGQKKLFVKYDHPSPEYFKILVAELKERELIP